ncbi:OstA-like protein [Mucilaginibacter calamicampi]|uniref:OstA-like protein n=1 Tax=Mucilaginibacter calamicampi TaxID=1302352 RepID=A0ABW2Z0C8_9SPHI
MSKYVLSLLLLFITCTAMAQRPGTSRVTLLGSDSASVATKRNGKPAMKFYRGSFRQDYSTLTADSSLFYYDDNMVDSYGHVIINQGDTLHIFADKLHYDGNTKLATLTGNVKMVDKDATLTTDFFTYNTATKFGTYTGGGKLFNKDNTLTSKNGYYLAGSRDAYFRYNVICTTPDAIIRTDTLRYNSGSRISWFYGPTTITGTKDKDVLYTENGRYETQTEQAFFGKKNLYTQGSKTLKGDSLFYDRLKGYGRAVKNVVFDDKEQHATVKGHLGEYYKDAETAKITQNPYVVFVTQDSSKSKVPADSVIKTIAKDSLSAAKKGVAIKKTALAVTSANSKSVPNQITAAKPTLKAVTDSVIKSASAAKIPAAANLTLKAVTDTVMKAAQQKGNAPPNKAVSNQKANPNAIALKDSAALQPTAKVDSMYMGADTIITRVITVKQEREMKLARYLLDNPDTAAARRPKSVMLTKATLPKVLKITPPSFPTDTSFIHPDFFGAPVKPAAKPVVKAPAPKSPVNTKPAATKAVKIDSVALKAKMLSDTAKVRIIIGYHAAKIFKSDLQAKADSIYYSSSDSTIRLFVNPIIWTQGSQLTGDTIALQMKNRKIDNIDLFPNGFIVNIEKNDSLHFNQVSGKKIHGTFKDSRLNTMEVNGNAETIYFNRDSVKNVVTEMAHEIANIIKARFKNGKLGRANTYGNTEMKANAINKVKDDDKILKGFIWKPQERPKTKEDITGIAGKPNAPVVAVKPSGGKKATAPPAATKGTGKETPVKPGTDKPATTPVKDAAPPKQVVYDVIISN